ncbi:MAG: hypothetical protein JETT_1037 [Candidatus Jettenia ecosi]|uniref:Uncharacterized protein n=1 Tax=Candidatus Jettenia ecosi TaxID=2494326 RepID=A0A533QDB8_9BACT|nr:MAG: hypothetical protein JETT_1037 [Candidatus Jettenia ecosi]
MRDHPPGGSPSDHPSQPIEDFSQRIISLRSILFHQGQVRGDKCPFSISDITWVWFSFVFIWFHTQIITVLSTKAHNTLKAFFGFSGKEWDRIVQNYPLIEN